MSKQEYIAANRQWLQQKAQEDGVQALDKGIYYRAIKKGKDGVSPNRNSVITVHYTGRTINGKKFDSSLGGAPVAMRLRDLIQGWVIALQQMHVGDKWEIYLPAEMGMAVSPNPESLAVPRWFSKSN